MSVSSFSGAAKRLVLAGALHMAMLSAAMLSAAMLSAAIVVVPTRADAAATGPAIPAIQHSVPVTVDAATTAFLVLDLTSAVCTPNPRCIATLPAAANLLAKARIAGALVVYSKTVVPGDRVLSKVAPRGGEQTVAARANKFFGTELANILRAHAIKTVVMVGSRTNGAILYTSFAANARGYTAVVAADGASADTDFVQHYSLFQLLNQPGFPNAANTPLAPHAVTLSDGNLITFRR